MGEFRVVVPTASYEVSRRFYGELLGWPLQRDWPDPGRGAIYEAGGNAVVELLDESDASPPNGVFCSVQVEDATGFAAALTGRGVELSVPLARQPWGHLNFEVNDPNGLRIVFFEVL